MAFTKAIESAELSDLELSEGHTSIYLVKLKVLQSFYADVLTTASDRDYDFGHINENIKLFATSASPGLKPAFGEIAFSADF